MKRHTPEEIVTKLRRIEALAAEGSTVAEAVREIGVTEVTYYRWRKKYADIGKPEARRLRELEKENARLLRLARDHPRYGYRRAWAVLRAEGWAANKKRVHRLWREAGLQVPQKTRKRRRVDGAASGENSTVWLAPARPNHIWCYDFVFDATDDGRALKLLPVLDEYTRECLALVVGRSLTSYHVVVALDRLIKQRGAPPSCAATTAPNSSPTELACTCSPLTPTPSTSTPALRGRTGTRQRENARRATQPGALRLAR